MVRLEARFEKVWAMSEEHELEVIKFAVMQSVSPELVADMQVDVAKNWMSDLFSVRLTQRMIAYQGEPVPQRSEQVPVGWLDHLWLSLTAHFVDLDADWDEREGFWWRMRDRARTRAIATEQTLYRVCPHGLATEAAGKERHFRWVATGK